ncbi:MAG: DUF445 domain-containing protein [Acidimicrobiales bacterium]
MNPSPPTENLAQAAIPLAEQVRRRQLVVAKRRATAALVTVAVVFLVVTVWGSDQSWAGYVQATAEAALVGGLADWFAVTALFRRPLGLPIPHTAIVVERKEQFGVTLGEFIQESFLTPEVVVERVRAAAVVPRVADWLADPAHSKRAAAHLAETAVALADLAHDDDIHTMVEDVVRTRLEAMPLAPLAGRALRFLTTDGRHHDLFDAGARGLATYLGEHREELRRQFSGRSRWWLPGAIEERLFDRLVDGARRALTDMVGDPDHDLRRHIEAGLTQLAVDLETSASLWERGERLKADLVSQPQLRRWAATLWRDAKAQLRTQAADPGSELRVRLEKALTTASERLGSDELVAAKVQDGVESAARYVAEHFSGEIADLVSGTISRWDGEQTSHRLELLLGPDLQYIRLNGTVVGGVAGLALHTIARALG